MKQYAILGLGVFGKSLVINLMKKNNVEVLAVDKNMDAVDEIKDIATMAMRFDTTQRDALQSIEIKKFDVVVISMGEDMMSSILTALLLKDLGVKRIIARYAGERHKVILQLIGIEELVSPEENVGEQIALNIEADNVLSYFKLVEGYYVTEVKISGSFVGKTIKELDIRNKYRLNIIDIKTETVLSNGSLKTTFHNIPNPQTPLTENDTIIVVGSEKDLDKFKKKMMQ